MDKLNQIQEEVNKVIKGKNDTVQKVLAAVIAGCDGLEIEVHDEPDKAFTEKEQAITPDELSKIMKIINKYM